MARVLWFLTALHIAGCGLFSRDPKPGPVQRPLPEAVLSTVRLWRESGPQHRPGPWPPICDVMMRKLRVAYHPREEMVAQCGQMAEGCFVPLVHAPLIVINPDRSAAALERLLVHEATHAAAACSSQDAPAPCTANGIPGHCNLFIWRSRVESHCQGTSFEARAQRLVTPCF